MINKQPYESVSMKEVFSKGNLVIKLSFLIMGLANLLNRQIIKGLLFLVTEILFLISFFTQIIPALKKIITLGTKTQGVQTKVIDGIKMQVVVNGDNSMLILIFGLAAIIFVYFCFHLLD
ncbi:maltose/maltodextrin ABC transport system permease protein [Streptococcus parauberis KCTC 11537]|nr:maltose/maltodextrin ABC transport system permease protein [Streptococcus parauberis KCTC 11537]